MSEPCVRGCTTRGDHRTTCPDDECRGCLPRSAEFGTLCIGCHGRLTRSLYQAPRLVAYLRGVDPQQGDEANVKGTREQPIPLNTAAVDAADELHAMLCAWVLLILEEHPDRLVGPDARGSRMTEPSKRRYQATPWLAYCADCEHCVSRKDLERPAVTEAGWHTDAWMHNVTVVRIDPEEDWAAIAYFDAQVAGLKPDSDEAPTTNVCRWLLAQQEWAERQEWAGEIVRELASTIATLQARFPSEESSRHIPDLPCRRCDRITLSYHPPTFEGAKFLVQCDHHACGEIVPEEEWGLFVRRIVDEVGARPEPPEHEQKILGRSSDGYGGAA